MRAETHQLLALSVYLASSPPPIHDIQTLLLQVAAVTTGALLPDLDSPYSAFGQRLKGISYPLNKLLGHRGAAHSLFALMGLFLILAFTPIHAYAVYLAMGYFSHLIGDLLFTSKGPGIALFWPMQQKVHLMQLKVGGRVEWSVMLGLLALDAALFIRYQTNGTLLSLLQLL